VQVEKDLQVALAVNLARSGTFCVVVAEEFGIGFVHGALKFCFVFGFPLFPSLGVFAAKGAHRCRAYAASKPMEQATL